MLAEHGHVGGIVVRDHDGVVVDSDVALQAGEQRLGEMVGVPNGVGFAEQMAGGVARPGRSDWRGESGGDFPSFDASPRPFRDVPPDPWGGRGAGQLFDV